MKGGQPIEPGGWTWIMGFPGVAAPWPGTSDRQRFFMGTVDEDGSHLDGGPLCCPQNDARGGPIRIPMIQFNTIPELSDCLRKKK